MVTIAECSTYAEAMVLKASLEAYGVSCSIPDENSIRIRGGILPGLSLMQQGVLLQVAEGDAETARDWLKRAEDSQPSGETGRAG